MLFGMTGSNLVDSVRGKPVRPKFSALQEVSIMTIGKIIVWLIIGALAGTLAGRLVTFKKEGFGLWTNVGLGMLGAVVGGFLFGLLNIDLGLGELKITFEDLISAFVGSLLCIIAWWLIRKTTGPKS
jgi:uncharacterized membrane protein YeaQ/YmgE (transglycosylase-associated protein family)